MPFCQQDIESLALRLLRENPQAAYSFFWNLDALHLIAERKLLSGSIIGGVAVHKILLTNYGDIALREAVRQLHDIVEAQATVPDDQILPSFRAVSMDTLPEPVELQR